MNYCQKRLNTLIYVKVQLDQLKIGREKRVSWAWDSVYHFFTVHLNQYLNKDKDKGKCDNPLRPSSPVRELFMHISSNSIYRRGCVS